METVVGFVVGRRRVALWEVRMRTYALLRVRPEAIDWRASEVASEVGATSIRTVSSVIMRVIKLQQQGKWSQ